MRPAAPASTTIAIHGACRIRLSPTAYARSSPVKNGSVLRNSQPCARCCRSRRVVSIGVSVNATSAEMITAPAIVTPNSRNSRPDMPPMNSSGKNTIARVMVVEMTAMKISRVPAMPAASGAMPASILA
jgi:hypothetical protein